jgi:hypothetical protein
MGLDLEVKPDPVAQKNNTSSSLPSGGVRRGTYQFTYGHLPPPIANRLPTGPHRGIPREVFSCV